MQWNPHCHPAREANRGDTMFEKVLRRPTVSGAGLNRRSFLSGATFAGLGAATATVLSGAGLRKLAAVSAAEARDTAADILTAALIAESLAITTYYTALSSEGVITDPNLAGAGGTAIDVSASGSVINVAYLQGALLEEVAHAQLLRTLLGLPADGSKDDGAGIPQTFYYPRGTFESLKGFLPVLLALETAFIGAYMTAVEEFASMAAGYNGFDDKQANPASASGDLTQGDLILYAKVASSILGVEAEHRALVRGIPAVTLEAPNYAGIDLIPANNLHYESSAGLTGLIVSVNGHNQSTAAAALTPFFKEGTNPTSVDSEATRSNFSMVVSPSVAANVKGSIPAAE
jgi:hypothetical protein